MCGYSPIANGTLVWRVGCFSPQTRLLSVFLIGMAYWFVVVQSLFLLIGVYAFEDIVYKYALH